MVRTLYHRSHTIALTTALQSYQNAIEETKPTAVITLPYLQGLSEASRRILGEHKIEVRFKPHTTLRQILVKPKDPIPITSRKGVVYTASHVQTVINAT